MQHHTIYNVRFLPIKYWDCMLNLIVNQSEDTPVKQVSSFSVFKSPVMNKIITRRQIYDTVFFKFRSNHDNNILIHEAFTRLSNIF